jgi:lipoprotein-anchoring transpeptidase ErfK/SrfK
MLPGNRGRDTSHSSGAIAKEDTLRVQIFLDSKGFGPGVVDGRSGEFTGKALYRYQQANGLPPNWRPDISNITTLSNYTVTAKDLAVLGTMASEPEDQAKQSKMPYTTLIELLSERFHTTQKFLRTLNPGEDINSMSPGSTVTVPAVVRPFRFDAFPSTYPAPSSGIASSRRVFVDLSEKMLEVREGHRLIAAFPITPGSTEYPAPAGEWRITGAVPWPWYRYDLGVLKRGERTDDFFNLPPGPNNPVGILWAGLNRSGIGIHGTPVPDTIGRAGSHGCIRLSNWDAATFYTLVGKGTQVTIR